MSHIRNIKDMLNIQTGSRYAPERRYSSFTDSQHFFGPPLWHETSQGLSQDMSASSRNSQQSSQDGSDPKFSSNYQSKPLLFGDPKDKSRAYGVFDQFEEEKKRAKEKTDNETLTKEFHHILETLGIIQHMVADSEKKIVFCQTLLEKYDIFASTFEKAINSLQSCISEQFEMLLNKLNSPKETTVEVEDKIKKSGEISEELISNMQSSKKSLESLREDQAGERNMLEEVLKLLSNLASDHSAKSRPREMVDSTIQTSPSQGQQISNILQNNKLEDTKKTCQSYEVEHNQAGVTTQNPSRSTGKRRQTRCSVKKRKKSQPTRSQKRKHSVTDENSPPLVNHYKTRNVYRSPDNLNTPSLKPRNKEAPTRAGGKVFTSFNCWSQDDSSPLDVSGIIGKLLVEPKTAPPTTPVSFWELFD